MWAVGHRKDVVMPKHFPQEFKRDVVAVARSSGLTQAQVSRDFGISENWVAR
jgi:transposase